MNTQADGMVPASSAQGELERAGEQLTKGDILDLAPFKVYVVDLESLETVYTNMGTAQQSALPPGNTRCHQLIYHEDRPCIACKRPQLLDTDGKPNGTVIISERFNEIDDCWYQLREGTLTLRSGRAAMYSIAIDIGETKKIQNDLAEAHAELAFKNQLLERLTVTDPLTGLFNRRKFDEVFSQECERALRTQQPLSLILVDIDHFKSVNDVYGHPMGDRLLVTFADILRQGVRSVDMVARWGGEEFVILCPSTSLASACTVAENIRHMVADHDFVGVGHKTCCLGVADFRPGEAHQAVVQRADEALYRAKNGGRNQVCSG